MSAQAGIWNFDGQPVDPVLLEKLGSAIQLYGPDGGRNYAFGPLGMAYRAFHTTRESRLEKQPYVSTFGTVTTWDGRLDNREDLIDQLGDELAGDTTDVALVTAAFDRWGLACFQRVIGDWAVSIWKPIERELFLACDFMCTRHIFYYPKKDGVWWSTDLAPLVLLSGDKFQIDDEYISGYFAHDPDAHVTPYRGIRQVPGGHFVRVRSNGSVSVKRFWAPSPRSRIRYRTDAEYEEHFRFAFRQAVRRRLRSDSPILAELSGGLDSSSIVCMADEILANEGAQTPRLDTLSVYDKTEPNGDDWIYFPKVENERGRAGVHLDASKQGTASQLLSYPAFFALPGYIGYARELDAERAAVIQNGGYRVVLSGIGGDEFMGGVPNPAGQLADLVVQFKFITLAKQLMAWSLIKRRPWMRLLWQALLELMPPSLSQHFSKQATIEPWIEKHFANRTRLAIRRLDVDEHLGFWLPTRRACISGVILMANKQAKYVPPKEALEETSYPYLDQNLIEFILSIPANQLLRPGERRSLMRRALAGIVPAEILSRRTKQLGARTPLATMEKEFVSLQSLFDSPLCSRLGFIDREYFASVLHNAVHGKDASILRLMRTLSLELWLRDIASRGLIDMGAISHDSLVTKTAAASA